VEGGALADCTISCLTPLNAAWNGCTANGRLYTTDPITSPVNENGSGWPNTDTQAPPSTWVGDISTSR
jgi:hypothetical protein